ncbi:GL21610 [Drosophila persimilis]|uniref:GL21610 n=1 Tax=Drosophila persimilis TaxID=7234 RepID=B4GFK3_DROPE|nr:GL21610 [Drosophila persimilis]
MNCLQAGKKCSHSIPVSRDDGLPQEICRQCMAQFLMVAKFRRKCVRMQQRLQDYAQEISDRQAARQAKRKQKQQQRQAQQQEQTREEEAKDMDTDANSSDYMHLPESQMERKRRIISESEGESLSPRSSRPKIVKTEQPATEEVLPPPKERRLQLRLRRMRTQSAGTPEAATNANVNAVPDPVERPATHADPSSMPWKTKAARKQLSESWSSYSPAPSSEIEGRRSTSSEAATEHLSDLSVGPLCGFESDSSPSSTSAPSILKFPRRSPTAVPALRRGRRPRSSPVYMPVKRQRRSVGNKSMGKELLHQIGAESGPEQSTKSDEEISGQDPREQQPEIDENCPTPLRLVEASSSCGEASDISTSDADADADVAGESSYAEVVKELQGKDGTSGDEGIRENPVSAVSIKELSSSSDASDESTLKNEEETPSHQQIEGEPKLNGAVTASPASMEVQSKELTSSTEVTAPATATATATVSEEEQESPDGAGQFEQPDIIRMRTRTRSRPRMSCQWYGLDPRPMDFLAEFEKHCEKGLEQIGATTPAPSPPPTPRAEPLPLALNDLEAKQQLEVEMNDVETTLNGILNEMQDQHMYTPTCPHIDEFLTPADYASLSDPEPEPEQEQESSRDCSPVAVAVAATEDNVSPLREKPGARQQEDLFDNSNFSNELIGFQNDIPCFENIEASPEPDQSLHLELTQFLNELQPQQGSQATQVSPGAQVQVQVAAPQVEAVAVAVPPKVQHLVEPPLVEQQPQAEPQVQVQVQQPPLEHIHVRQQPTVAKALEQPQLVQVPQVHHQETTTTVSYEQIYHHHHQQSASKLQLMPAHIDTQQQQQQQQWQHGHAVGGLEAIKGSFGPSESTTTYYISAGDLYQHQQQAAPLETTYTMLDPNENYMLEQATHQQQQQLQQIHHQQQQQQQQAQQHQQQQQQQPIMILIQQPELQQPVASASNPQQAPLHFYGAPISNELHHLQQQQQQQQHQQQQHQVQNQSVLAAASPMPATTPKGRAVSLKCRFCQNGPRFSNSLEYSRHIIELHPAVAPFNCPHCPLAFAARSKRSQHILNQHVVQQYQCGQCSQVFPAQRALDLHIQRFHMQITSNTGGAEKGAGVRVEEVQLQISNEHQQQHSPHPKALELHGNTPRRRRQRILCCPDCEDCTSGHSHGHGQGQYEELQTNLQAPPTALTPPSTIMSVPSPQPLTSTHQHITLPSPEQSEPDSTTTLRQFRKRGVIVGPQSAGAFSQSLQLATPVASPSPSPSSSPSSSTIDSAPNTPASASVQVSELRTSHQCLYCEERFTNDIALRKHHLLAHGAQTSMPFVCTICKRGYRMRTALHRHMESHDVEGRPYECNLCHVRFPRPSQLTLHKITVHLLSKPHTCDECGKQFGTESALKTHVKFHGELGYQCDECDQAFEYLRDLRKHRRTHNSELFYKCEFCPRSFLHFMGFRAHMNSHLPLGVFLNEETALKSASNCSTTSIISSVRNDKSSENPATPIMEETPLTPMSNINNNSDECCPISNSAESSALAGRSLPSLDSIATTP